MNEELVSIKLPRWAAKALLEYGKGGETSEPYGALASQAVEHNDPIVDPVPDLKRGDWVRGKTSREFMIVYKVDGNLVNCLMDSGGRYERRWGTNTNFDLIEQPPAFYRRLELEEIVGASEQNDMPNPKERFVICKTDIYQTGGGGDGDFYKFVPSLEKGQRECVVLNESSYRSFHWTIDLWNPVLGQFTPQ